MSCMVVESTFWIGILGIVYVKCKKKDFEQYNDKKKPQRPYQYAAHIYAFLQFNLATLEYVTDIAFIDAVMHFSAALWTYTESSSLRWWINFRFILKVVIDVANDMQTIPKCALCLMQIYKPSVDLCQFFLHQVVVRDSQMHFQLIWILRFVHESNENFKSHN